MAGAAVPVRAPASRLPRPLSIRRARKTDVPQLVAVEIAAFRDYYRPHRLRAADFLAYLAKPETLALVAEAPGGVVGYALGSVLLGILRQIAFDPYTQFNYAIWAGEEEEED